MTDTIAYWVQVFKDDYLPEAKYQGDESIELCEERAVESLISELRDALRDAEQEWWDERCSVCDGDGSCTDCDGAQEIETDDGTFPCETCQGIGLCPHCGGTGLEHAEK